MRECAVVGSDHPEHGQEVKAIIVPVTGATLDYVEVNPGELRYIFINPNDPSHKQPGTPR